MLINHAQDSKTATLNEYFHFPLSSGNLVTTRHGGWVVLSEEEYKTLKSKKVEYGSELFRKLEEVGVVLTEKSSQKIIQDLRITNSFLYASTAYHVISVTNKCNFNCIYCHPDAKPEKDEMDEKTATKILDFIFSVPMLRGCQVVIEGGEPLMKWDLIMFLYREGKKRAEKRKIEFRFSFTSNLSLMSDKIAKDIIGANIHPCVSLDGPKELHDKQRPFIGGEGSYDKVIYWSEKLKKDYNIKLHAIPVITGLSLKYGPKAIIDEYLKFGQEVVFFKPFRASGSALSAFNEIVLDPKDFYNFWQDGIEYCLSLQKKGIKIKELNAQYLISNMLSPQRRSMCHRYPCGAGLSILSYNCDGTINGCDATRGQGFLDFGHVDTDDYQSIRAKALPLLALTADLTPICSSCPFMSYCGLCLSDNFGRENDLYPKIPRSFGCQWQKPAFAYLFNKLAEDKEDAQILRSWAMIR